MIEKRINDNNSKESHLDKVQGILLESNSFIEFRILVKMLIKRVGVKDEHNILSKV